jgi:hypothetical protein
MGLIAKGRVNWIVKSQRETQHLKSEILAERPAMSYIAAYT